MTIARTLPQVAERGRISNATGVRYAPGVDPILDAGTLPLPAGCHSEVRVSIKVPAKAPTMPTTGKVVPSPATSLVYSRHASTDSALKVLGHVLDLTRQQGPGVTLLGEAELTFDDGRAGVSATLSLQVDATTTLNQKHFVRADDGVVTHFVLTAPSLGFDRTEREWSDRIKAFRIAS